MDCAQCGHGNRPEARFCAGCGAAAVQKCSGCDEELTAGARFCDQCGTPVESGSVESRQTVAPEVEAVRKTVTVLFCDLVGSTAFAERVDPEAARDAMGRYHGMAQETIEANGGAVAKFIGDGVMALWGVPEVAEDDAHRAVACGSALQAGFAAIERYVAERHGVDVGLRVGINTGEVVIADEDADIVGDVLNTAARLEAACIPGQVLVGEETWRLTRSSTTYDVLREMSVKGKQDPVPTFQVRDDAAAEDDLATPFVGRDSELAELRLAFDRAVELRAVQLATVIGSPGVGKTRLAAELAESVGEETVTFDLRCERAGNAAFAPIRDLLLGVAHIEPDSDPDQKLTALDALFDPSIPDKDRLVELLGGFVGASEPRSTEESFFAIRRVLEVLGAQRPVLVVVDDIQWAEPLLLDLLEHLAEWVSGGAVMILGLARPEIRSIRPSMAEVGRGVSAVVSLEGLDAAATEQLAAQLLGVERLPADLVARLPESTEGNPLFVRELVRMLADDGTIVRSGETYELTIDADAVEVPPTIQSLLAARVERLPADERRLIELASVVGPEFARGALVAIAPDVSATGVDAVLERLRRKALIDPTGTYWGDEPILRFHHVLIRDAAYRRLLKGARADLHLAVGRWTEETAGSALGDHDAAIAFHFEQTHQYRSELGPLDQETQALGRHAANLLHSAALRALEGDDLASAGSFARRALARLERDDRNRPALLLVACEALASSGDIGAAKDSIDELAAIANDRRLAGWVTCHRGQVTVFTDPAGLADVVDQTAAAAGQLADIGDDAGVAKARQVRALALARLGRVGDCEAELDMALTAARAADDRRRVTAVLGAAPLAALWGPSTVPRAGGRCLDVIRLLRITSGSPAVEAVSVRCQAVLEALRGRFDTARNMLATSRATAEELGLRHGLLETELYTGIVELLADEPGSAEPHLRAAHAGLGRMGIGADAGQAGAYLARALLLQGRLDEADRLATEAELQAGQNLQTVITAKSVRGEILAAQGDLPSAISLAEEAVVTAAGTDIIVDHANAMAALARVKDLAGDAVGAAGARTEAQRLFDAKGATTTGGGEHRSQVTPLKPDQTSTLEGLPGPLAKVVRGLATTYPARDIEGVARLISPQLVQHDHRTGMRLELDHSQFLESIRGLFAERGKITVELATVDARRPTLGLFHAWLGRAAISVSEFLTTLVVDDQGRLEQIMLYDVDARDEALAELHRLDRERSGSVSGNRAVGVLEKMLVALEVGDYGASRDQLAPSFVREDRRGGVPMPAAGPDEYIETMRSFYELGGVGRRHDAAATRADRVVLMPFDMVYSDEFESTMLLVARIDGQGRMDLLIGFDSGDLDAAMAELDRLAGESEEPALASSAIAAYERLVGFFGLAEDSGVEEILHPDFVREDRRSGFSMGVADRAEFIASLPMLADREGGVPVTRTERLEVRGQHLCTTVGTIVRQTGEESRMAGVLRVAPDGRIDRIIVFDPDNVASAIDEMRRLYLLELGTDPASTTVVKTVFGHFTAALESADRAGAYACLSPGMSRVDRRSGFSMPTADRDAYIASLEALYAEGDTVSYPGDLIATRGDDLLLVDTRFVRSSGSESRILAILGVDADGLIDLMVAMDPEDTDAAIAELDSRHADRTQDPVPPNLAVDAYARLAEFFEQPEASDAEAVLHPDMVREDRRTGFSMGVADRSEYVALLARPEGGSAQSIADVVDVRANHLAVIAGSIIRSTGERTDFTATIRAVPDGRIDRILVFDPDEAESAIDEMRRLYLRELVGSGAASPAVVALHRFSELADAFDEEAALTLIAPNMTRIDIRSGLSYPVADRSAFVDSMRPQPEDGQLRFVCDIVAERSDDLILVRARRVRVSGGVTSQLAVVGVDREGRIDLVVIMDPDDLDAATAELHRVHAERTRSAAPVNRCSDVFGELLSRLSPDDWSVYDELVAPNVVREDRRTGVTAPIVTSRDEIIENQAAMFDVGFAAPSSEPVEPRGDRLMMFRVLWDSGDGNSLPILTVARIDAQDRLDRLVFFDSDDHGAARAELDRLYAEASPGETRA